ncbi:uncharacterized protein LOC142978621 [Anticarsia gemmatalis]|uniref:uncharacterized protein LOC142978621 n=1 Tax=Anticarsia gemmatalis TaxID=129554 RepID=UPI003F757BA3
MSTRWKCRAHNEKTNTTLYYIFEVHVKGTRKAQVKLDETELNFAIASSSVEGYDGLYEYRGEVGDTIELNCNHNYTNSALKLRYYNAQGTKITEVERLPRDKYQLTFIQTLSAENNGSHIDCITLSPLDDYQQEFTYRTLFTVNEHVNRNNNFRVRVNNVKLAPQIINETETYRYRPIYSSEESSIHCEFKYKGIPINYTESSPRGSEIKSYRCFSTVNFHCLINILKSRHREPQLSGLVSNNTLYQYSVNENEWVIAYRYKPDDELTITCSTQEQKNLKLIFGDKIIGEGVNGKSIKGNFPLNEEHHMTKIYCEASALHEYTKRNTIVLHRVSDSTNSDKFKILNDDTGLLAIIASGAGALVAIIAGICFIIHRRNKHKNQNGAPYKPFNNDNPIPPYPRQWETYDYAYATNFYTSVNNENSVMENNSLYVGSPTYAVPNKKRLATTSTCTESHYTEIDPSLFPNIQNIRSALPTPYEQLDIVKDIPSSSEDYNDLEEKSKTNYSNIPKCNNNEIKNNFLEELKNKSNALKKGSRGTASEVGTDNYVNFQPEDSKSNYSNLIESSRK